MGMEIRVRPVTRYVVTRHYSYDDLGTGGCETLGEFDCEAYAEEVVTAMNHDPESHKRKLIELQARYANEAAACRHGQRLTREQHPRIKARFGGSLFGATVSLRSAPKENDGHPGNGIQPTPQPV